MYLKILLYNKRKNYKDEIHEIKSDLITDSYIH